LNLYYRIWVRIISSYFCSTAEVETTFIYFPYLRTNMIRVIIHFFKMIGVSIIHNQLSKVVKQMSICESNCRSAILIMDFAHFEIKIYKIHWILFYFHLENLNLTICLYLFSLCHEKTKMRITIEEIRKYIEIADNSTFDTKAIVNRLKKMPFSHNRL
jgi:hypothetical protein